MEPDRLAGKRTTTGIMKLASNDLAKLVDDTVTALRVHNPPWLAIWGDSLPAKVQDVLMEGARVALDHDYYETGSIRVERCKEGEFTEVYVLVGTVYDEGTLHDPGSED